MQVLIRKSVTGLRVCIPKELPGDTVAIGPGPQGEKPGAVQKDFALSKGIQQQRGMSMHICLGSLVSLAWDSVCKNIWEAPECCANALWQGQQKTLQCLSVPQSLVPNEGV